MTDAHACPGYTCERPECIRRQRDELRAWVADLQSGMYVNCVYCGHRYGPQDEVPATMADVLKKHVEICPAHPMSALRAERDELRERCERMREDAARWEKIVELWLASTELQLTQDEDGAWSITVIEAVEMTRAPGRWTGDTPDEAVDALAAPKDAP